MKITRNEILHVASLARLHLDEGNVERFTRQLGEILEYMDTLNQVDTSGVRPTSHAIFITNAFRDDEAEESMDLDDVLANAPEGEDGDFIVPRVI
ncbi:Asp-tRNA(Asn)/Glu-tRNA(Gln) amidotransferase subunit GatC [Thermodesulfobacteriota bacterium]